MIVNVLNESFEKIAEVNEYKSLIFCKRYNEIGAIDLQIEATVENLRLFKKNYYLILNNRKSIFKIDAIEINTRENQDNSLIIGAVDGLAILNKRINTHYSYKDSNGNMQNVFNGQVENYIRNLILFNFISPTQTVRKIDNFQMTDVKNFPETIDTTYNFVPVGEEVLKTCKTYKLGCEINYEHGIFYFNLYKGLDRSIEQSENSRIVFSPMNENIVSSKYSVDASNVKNSVVPYDSKIETQDKYNSSTFNRADNILGNKSGLRRDEMLVDIQDVVDLTSLLKTSIAENKEKIVFEGEVFSENYVYGKDYNLGDVVTVQNEFGITAKARIVEVCETWDTTGYSIEPIFEYEEVEEFNVDETPVALLTENNIPMTTENGIMLLSEDMPSENGVKISELAETNEIKDGCCLPIVQDGVTKKVYYSTIKQDITPDFEIDTNGHLLAKYSE